MLQRFQCPECPLSEAAPSRFRWWEWPYALLLRRPYRCSHCGNRFWDFML
jgi:predicted RNA-binding Zn-ribbon protein involved in translation (DUF1610 family)